MADSPEFHPETIHLIETAGFTGGDPINEETYIHYFGRADNFIRLGEAIGQVIVDRFVVDTKPSVSPTVPTASPMTESTSTESPTSTSESSPLARFGVFVALMWCTPVGWILPS